VKNKEHQLPPILRSLICTVLLLGTTQAAPAPAADPAAARRQALQHSYGTYGANLRKPDGHIDSARLLADLADLHANTYNWLIAGAATDWDDLHTFLPLAHKQGLRVWVTLLPPSESPPKGRHFSEPFRLDFEKWVSELAALSAREPALVAWSVDDFAYNLKEFTPERMEAILAVGRDKNPNFAFVPCVYFKQANAAFAKRYGKLLDGILFPYRSDSTTSGFADATQVAPEVKKLKERFGADFPVIVDIYATRHSRLGASTPDYVGEVMKHAQPVADGVHIYKHQDKNNPQEREKYEVIKREMSSWPSAETSTSAPPAKSSAN
jgi:hypothetical protein